MTACLWTEGWAFKRALVLATEHESRVLGSIHHHENVRANYDAPCKEGCACHCVGACTSGNCTFCVYTGPITYCATVGEAQSALNATTFRSYKTITDGGNLRANPIWAIFDVLQARAEYVSSGPENGDRISVESRWTVVLQ